MTQFSPKAQRGRDAGAAILDDLSVCCLAQGNYLTKEEEGREKKVLNGSLTEV